MKLFFSLLYASSFAMENKQTTPFPLLEDFSKDAIRYVPECRYHVLKKGEIALIGPLNPCIFVACRDKETGKTLVFHKYYSSSLNSMKEIVGKEFLDIKTLEILIFGTRISQNEEDEQERRVNARSPLSLFMSTGRTVRGDIKNIKESFITYGIEKENITAQIWTLAKEYCKDNKYLNYNNPDLKCSQAELYVACQANKEKNLKETIRSIDLKDPYYLLEQKKTSAKLYEKEQQSEIEAWQKECIKNPSTSHEFSKFYPINKN